MEKWTRALYQPGLPMGEDGRRVTASPAHIALSKEAAKEGMVLLKNEEGTLPLKKGTKVALFGKATFDYVKGGGGSGDVTVPYARNLYEGLTSLNHVVIYEPLADFYRGYVEEQYRNGQAPGKPSEPAVPEELARQAEKFADTAIISICRFSGEGADRPEADFYLTGEENAMVEAVKKSFTHIIVVLNIGGVVSAEWFRAEPRIQAALLAWQGGIEGGLAAAELLCGIGNPCGKLADTFAKEIADYPSTATFGESDDYVTYTEDIYVGYRYFETIPGAADRVAYPFGYGLSYTTFDIQCLKTSFGGSEEADDSREEAVSVSDTSAGTAEPLNGHGEAVHGTEKICFTVYVKNTGNMPGKEVVQLYVRTPGQKIETPARKLVDFAKTPELAPGEACTVVLKASLPDLASYDECGVIRKSAWVVEAGEYQFYIGNSVRDAKEVTFADESGETTLTGPGAGEEWNLAQGRFMLAQDVIVEVCAQKMTPQKSFPRLHRDGTYRKSDHFTDDLSKKISPDAWKSFSEENTLSEGAKDPEENVRDMSQTEQDLPQLASLKWEEMECVIPETRRVPRRCFLLKQDPVPQLIDVYRNETWCGSPRTTEEEKPAETAHEEAGVQKRQLALSQFVKSLPDQALAELLGGQPNTGVANTYGVGNQPRYGVPNIMTADGPAGLRIEKHCGVTTTAWPCATMLACTWDPEMVQTAGQAAAEEVKENNIGIWLAPAVNIHRNPLCGRNFEYYSEDPLLAGRIGAGMVRGIQSRNIAATVKHFALNNKEQNRKESDSRAYERAIREIYLKPFEIIVKEAGPWAIMSSYNIINGVRASERKDMLTDILRGEWGYNGLVMTDWWAFSEQYKEILAGNDLKMGCGYPERLLEAMEKGLITREDLERSAKRVLELILKID